MRTYEARFLTSGEVKKYLKHNDIVFLPVGAFEMHGEHGPLGTDTLVDEAFTRLAAERSKSLYLPPVNFTYTGATIPYPGTVWASLETTAAYLRSILHSLLDNGFRRIVLVGSHGPHGFAIPFVLRSLFEERVAAYVHCNPSAYLTEQDLKEVWGNDNYGLFENSLLLGAAQVLGKENLINPATWHTRKNNGVPHPVLKKIRLARLHTPYHFSEPNQHLAPLAGLDYARGFQILDRAVNRFLPVVKDLSSWADYLEKQRKAEKKRVNF
jgi:hypothetical protein